MKTIHKKLHKRQIVLLLAVVLPCLLMVLACAHKEFDVEIEEPENVTDLKKLETALTVTPEKAVLNPDYQISENIAVPFVPEYRLGPGDIIEIVYHISYGKTPDDYRLEVQDKISIHFPYHPQFSTTVLIRTDGKITVPMLGDINAESKTPVELAADLNKAYGRYLHNPSITVALEEFNVKIDELKKAITTAPRGQSKIAPIAKDGRIAFPLIGNLQGEGFTLAQLEKTINEKYSQYVRNLKATLILLEIHHPKFYILGEVNKPGSYEMQSSTNLLDAIASANGYTTKAYLSDIVVFRNDGLERPIAFKIDLAEALKRGRSFANLQIKAADIIYVPKSKLSSTNDLLEKIFTKGVYTIMPFSTVFSYGVKDLGGDYEGEMP